MKQTKRVKETVIEKYIEETIPDDEIEIVIGIDCKPFMARPSEYLKGVFEGTGINIDEDATDSRLFGAWIWSKMVKKSLWSDETARLVYARLGILYEKGFIRGAKLSPLPEE